MVVGGSIAYVVASAANRPQLVPTAGDAPDFKLTHVDSGTVAAFDLIDAPQTAVVLPAMAGGDLTAAADALLDASPPPGTTPLGFPRVPLVSQFDGGPFQNANCTLASGAMLARLAFGIVTDGSVLRSLQFDFDGGTDLHDLNTALHRGYGVDVSVGGVSVPKFRAILQAGGGAVVQGNYALLPRQLKLQKPGSFPHAVYIDGFFPGDSDTPAAYYIIDPLGRGSYKGGWWPADAFETFAFGFSGNDKIVAAWAFPPGGVPPVPINPDVPLLGGGPESTPKPGASPTPVPSGAGLPQGEEAGDEPPTDPGTIGDPPIVTPVDIADVDLVPFLTVCDLTPPPDGCPDGVPAVFDKPPPILHVDLGPEITVLSVDASAGNVAFVAYRVAGAVPSDVNFWQSDGTPPEIDSASSIMSLLVGGQPSFVARLDVLAGTEYHFQVVAGDGIFASQSPVGTFTTGSRREDVRRRARLEGRPDVQARPGPLAVRPSRDRRDGPAAVQARRPVGECLPGSHRLRRRRSTATSRRRRRRSAAPRRSSRTSCRASTPTASSSRRSRPKPARSTARRPSTASSRPTGRPATARSRSAASRPASRTRSRSTPSATRTGILANKQVTVP